MRFENDRLLDLSRPPSGARLPRPFAAKLAEGLPVCAAGEDATAPGASIVRCRMVGDSTAKTAAQIAAGLPAYLRRLPDRVNIASDSTANSFRLFGFNWLGTGRLGLFLAIGVMVLITGAVVLLTAVLGAKSAGADCNGSAGCCWLRPRWSS